MTKQLPSLTLVRRITGAHLAMARDARTRVAGDVPA